MNKLNAVSANDSPNTSVYRYLEVSNAGSSVNDKPITVH